MIPVNRPFFNGNEKKYLKECIDSGWVGSEGEFVERFEKGIADYVGRKFAASCSNGSAALDLAIKALKLPPDSEIILPSMTIISCAQSLVRNGHIPVLVDCDERTFNMKVEDVESKITKKTRAILIVHIYGLSVDLDPILALAARYDLKVIEDAAEVQGLEYKGRRCGSFGDVSTLSFYPNKIITTGEGGMVLTDDKDIFDNVNYYKNLCFSKNPDLRFIHEDIGWNYRFTNLQAAIGLAQLEQIDFFINRKRQIGEKYNYLLSDLECLNLPIDRLVYCKNIYWVYPIVLLNQSSEIIRRELFKNGVATRPFFYPLHKQPVFNSLGYFVNDRFPISEKLYKFGLYIPSGIGTTDDEIEQVCVKLRGVLK